MLERASQGERIAVEFGETDGDAGPAGFTFVVNWTSIDDPMKYTTDASLTTGVCSSCLPAIVAKMWLNGGAY